jgi:hypothetical protein
VASNRSMMTETPAEKAVKGNGRSPLRYAVPKFGWKD